MPGRLKVGIVGCGLIARRRHIPAYLKLKDKVTVQALCDTDESCARKLGNDYGIARIYSDYSRMLADEKLDIINICTPPQTHATLAIEGMEHGCHVIMEKPMALKVSDCDVMIEASFKNKVKLSVIHNMLFFPSLMKARKLVDQGAIGKFIGMRIFISDPRNDQLMNAKLWAHGLRAGILEESIAHPIYMSMLFTGKINGVDVWAMDYLKHPWTPFDEFRVVLEGERGMSSIVKSYASKSWDAIVDILGTNGSLSLDLHSNILIRRRPKESLEPASIALRSLGDAFQTIGGVAVNALKVVTGQMRYGQEIVIEKFVDSVINDSAPPVTAEEGRDTTMVAEMLVNRLYEKYGDIYKKHEISPVNKMRILQVVQFLTPVRGGSAIVPYQLSEELAKKGHDITVYTSDYKIAGDYKFPNSVKVFPLKTWLRWSEIYWTPGMIKRARQEISDVDIIHLHNYRTYQNLVVGRYAREYRIPYILQAHGSLTTYFQKPIRKRIFDRRWGFNLLKHASKVIAVTAIEAEQYLSMGVEKNKIEIVPNGIDLSEFDNLPEWGKFRTKFAVRNDEKVVLFLGRIEKLKGLSLLVEAMAGLSRSFADVRLVVVGPDAGDVERIKALAKSLNVEGKILFTGPLFGMDKLEAYVDSDVFVMPSYYEIFGISALEALMCGKPVIVTDRCGVASTLESSSMLVVKHDAKQIEDAISGVITNGFRQDKEIKEVIKTKFSWPAIANKMEDIYLSCIGKS